MSDEAPVRATTTTAPTWWQQHRFFGLVGVAVVIALILVGVALALYHYSGAAQLDLSRPGYQDVRKNVEREDNISAYPATGEFDKAAFEQFISLYDQRAGKVLTDAAYDPVALSDESLQLFPGADDAPAPQP